MGTQLSRCGERAQPREAGQRGGHRFTADADPAAMRTAAISGVQGLREAVGEPPKSLQSRDLGGAWPSYVERPAPAARVLSGTVETPGSGLPHRAPALPRPDSPATGTFDPELSLVGVAGDRRRERDGALGSKLWLLLLEKNKSTLIKQSRSHGREGGVPKAGTAPPPVF